MRSAPVASLALLVASVVFLAGCDALFGAKDDPTTREIFEEGESDPSLFEEVAYVPMFPFFTQSATGGTFQRPTDVFVGYDQFVYVTDQQGLHVLDRAGRGLNFISDAAGQPIRNAGCVMQDRRFDVYVCARRDTTIEGRTWDLSVVYRFSGLTTGNVGLADIIWNVFDDGTRRFSSTYRNPRDWPGGISDEDTEFTGVGVLFDNSVYISRRGPLNRPGTPPAGDGRPQVLHPSNALLIFNRDGVNTGRVVMGPGDHSVPSLRSTVYPSDVITYFAPPQSTGLPPRLDFFVAQAPPPGAPVPQPTFAVLAINAVSGPEGIEYRQDTGRIAAASDTSRGDGFLYQENKFGAPAGLARAGDGSGYLFVIDAAKDSLFVFNDAGIEGVAPPPGAEDRTKPFIVSFGGTGSGPTQFNRPSGVAYFGRVVYVADTENNRISRFRLNTDFE